MNLHRIAGVNHFDPTGRQRLIDWLALCSKQFGKPAFVATEWDKAIFDRVKGQREEFQLLISNQWPTLSPGLLKALTLSLAYEADAHVEVFPDVEVLWLDEGRQAPDNDIRNYARDRFEMYKRWLGDEILERDDSATLARMSERATLEAGRPPNVGCERDAKFVDSILRRVRRGGGDWTVVIVGKFHALAYNGSMRRLLEEREQICEVSLL
jgi:hypothetical protein